VGGLDGQKLSRSRGGAVLVSFSHIREAGGTSVYKCNPFLFSASCSPRKKTASLLVEPTRTHGDCGPCDDNGEKED